MAKAKRERVLLLKCKICGRENYTTRKNRQNTPEKLELKKYCPKCRKHTLHIETRSAKKK